MPSDAESALTDILEHIHLARLWTTAMRLEDFKQDRKTFYAVTRCLAIISEATRPLHANLAADWPDIPWRKIRDAGNFYRHQYDDVAEQDIWSVVVGELSALETFAKTELEARP